METKFSSQRFVKLRCDRCFGTHCPEGMQLQKQKLKVVEKIIRLNCWLFKFEESKAVAGTIMYAASELIATRFHPVRQSL